VRTHLLEECRHSLEQGYSNYHEDDDFKVVKDIVNDQESLEPCVINLYHPHKTMNIIYTNFVWLI
jgi:hypothetical protein